MFVFKPNLVPRWSYILSHVYQFYHNQIMLPNLVAVIASVGKGKKKRKKKEEFLQTFILEWFLQLWYVIYPHMYDDTCTANLDQRSQMVNLQ